MCPLWTLPSPPLPFALDHHAHKTSCHAGRADPVGESGVVVGTPPRCHSVLSKSGLRDRGDASKPEVAA
jgi:hypothetical protein